MSKIFKWLKGLKYTSLLQNCSSIHLNSVHQTVLQQKIHNKGFTLYVSTGCTLSETEREPKSKYTGDSVLLSCSCEDPNTKPEDFRWTHVESGTEVSNETQRYKHRVHMFHKTTPSNLSLLISNLTEDDQGTYRCTINHKTSADSRLIVKGEDVVLKLTQSLKSFSLAGKLLSMC